MTIGLAVGAGFSGVTGWQPGSVGVWLGVFLAFAPRPNGRADSATPIYYRGWNPNQGNSTDAFIRILSRQRGLNSVPGAEYQYNNGGYLLLGKLLERASGQTLGAFADANIFEPLGMTGAYFNGDPVRTAPDHASAYSPQAKGWRLLGDGPGYTGNAGMMASIRDLLLWANNFTDARVGRFEQGDGHRRCSCRLFRVLGVRRHPIGVVGSGKHEGAERIIRPLRPTGVLGVNRCDDWDPSLVVDCALSVGS